jgi:hypothetical protein
MTAIDAAFTSLAGAMLVRGVGPRVVRRSRIKTDMLKWAPAQLAPKKCETGISASVQLMSSPREGEMAMSTSRQWYRAAGVATEPSDAGREGV